MKEKRRRVSYVICSTPRTGSTLLCDLLKRNELFNGPVETCYEALHEDKLNELKIGIMFNLKQFFRRCFMRNAIRKEDFIIAGLKMHQIQTKIIFEIACKGEIYNDLKMSDLVRFLPEDVKFIWLRRRDLAAQALSLEIAKRDNFWNSFEQEKNPEFSSDPYVDKDKIDHWKKIFISQNDSWRNFFNDCGISPLEIYYEDLVSSREKTLKKIVDFLGISHNGEFLIDSEFKKQSGKDSIERIRKYRMEKIYDFTVGPLNEMYQKKLKSFYETSYELKKKYPLYSLFVDIIKVKPLILRMKRRGDSGGRFSQNLLKNHCFGPNSKINKGIISDENRFIYFDIPKVASSSIKAALSGLFGGKLSYWDCAHKFDFPFVEDIRKGDYSGHFKFAFVRNPWDRIVSCYVDKIKCEGFQDNNNYRKGIWAKLHKQHPGMFWAGMTFEEFVESICKIGDDSANFHFRSQNVFLTDRDGNLIVDYIGKFENLSNDLGEIFDRLDLNDLRLEHYNKSYRKSDYESYYNERTKRMIAQRYKEDIEMFGYEF